MNRPAYLAGQWYPAAQSACRRAIEEHAAGARPQAGAWRGLIGPHAGWSYSGDAAGRVYRWLAEARAGAQLVVLFASHRGPSGPNTLFQGDGWDTPLGPLVTARDVAERVAGAVALAEEPMRPAHPDNAVELHLPFIRYFFPEAELLMLGVAASAEALAVGARVGAVCKESGRDTVFIGSTDLTHYGPSYGFEPHGRGEQAVAWVREENDRGILDAILAGDAARAVEHGVTHASACCPGAVGATMVAVLTYGCDGEARLVDHYLSCDVQPAPSFVGYAGILL